MTEFSRLLIYVPGIVIFLVGSAQVRDWLRLRRGGGAAAGVVVSCTHVVKKDKKDRAVFDFYDVLVEYTDPRTSHKIRQNMKSPTEYAQMQPVRLVPGPDGKPALADAAEEPVFHPLAAMLGGALLILLALEENRGNEILAMLCLSLFMAGAGLSLIIHYRILRTKGFVPIDAEITGTYTRQISKETKILRGSRYTYYPIVRFEVDGQERLRRCRVNASSEKAFKAGETLRLWLDPATGAVAENNAKVYHAVLGAILLAAGLLAGVSILSQL